MQFDAAGVRSITHLQSNRVCGLATVAYRTFKVHRLDYGQHLLLQKKVSKMVYYDDFVSLISLVDVRMAAFEIEMAILDRLICTAHELTDIQRQELRALVLQKRALGTAHERVTLDGSAKHATSTGPSLAVA